VAKKDPNQQRSIRMGTQRGEGGTSYQGSDSWIGRRTPTTHRTERLSIGSRIASSMTRGKHERRG
jgi:hypothetical protein